MTTPVTTGPEAAGATLHLGGTAWCTPDLAPLLVPIDQLTPYPGNARRHDQDTITASLEDLGCHRAVNAQRSTGHCLVGNGMLRGLIDLGAAQVPVTWRECTDSVARQVVVEDNRTGDLATDDPVNLYALLDALAGDGVDLGRLGYPETELAVLARTVEAVEVFTVGTENMVDEFRAVSGQERTEYGREYARACTVYLRDDAAIAAFKKKLGVPAKDDLGGRLNFPLDWQPYDRRQTWKQERANGDD